MPLLGRHKSLPGGSNQNGNKQQQTINKQPVCESPLFGTRRQLPINSPTIYQTTAATATSTISSPTTNNHHVNNSNSNSSTTSLSDYQQILQAKSSGSSSSSSSINSSSQADAIGSVPQTITRQQIHYAFSIMDTNSDGLIDLRDLSQTLANLGVPIDEAILSHVMSTVSKRGDHLISEPEFLAWIGNFIQVSETSVEVGARRHLQQQQQPARPIVRSSTAGSSLAAQSTEAPPPGANLRQRRGSGSGLALVRSLSGGPKEQQVAATVEEQQQVAEPASSADQEARNDLKAAFCVFDLDGDGFITLDEVRAGLRLLGESWTPAELGQLFSQCQTAPAPSPAPQAGAGRRAHSRQRTQQAAAAAAAAPDLSRQRISIDDFVKLLL